MTSSYILPITTYLLQNFYLKVVYTIIEKEDKRVPKYWMDHLGNKCLTRSKRLCSDRVCYEPVHPDLFRSTFPDVSLVSSSLLWLRRKLNLSVNNGVLLANSIGGLGHPVWRRTSKNLYTLPQNSTLLNWELTVPKVHSLRSVVINKGSKGDNLVNLGEQLTFWACMSLYLNRKYTLELIRFGSSSLRLSSLFPSKLYTVLKKFRRLEVLHFELNKSLLENLKLVRLRCYT